MKCKFAAFHYQVTIAGNNSMDGKLTIVLQGTKGNTDPIALMRYVIRVAPMM